MSHPLVSPRGQWMRDVLTDEEVVARVVAGEGALFELLMRRHNQRLFRTVRALTRDDDAAEEVLQRAYVAAWQGLGSFEGRASFTTWITRIALNMCGASANSERRASAVTADIGRTMSQESEAADEDLSRGELRAILESAIDALPEIYRVVFVMRAVEGMSTAEVAHALDLQESAVKVRLHRAREQLRTDLLARAERTGALADAWGFDGGRCDRLVARVFDVIQAGPGPRGFLEGAVRPSDREG
jgi:RNA polymerase sigma-70 factor (ECF subfamily)